MRMRRVSHPSPWISLAVYALAVLFSVVASPLSSQAVPPRDEVSASSLEDLVIPRKPIPYSILGINAFANEASFGTMSAQFREVSTTLGIKHVRVLVAWNDQMQPSPSAPPSFAFYDRIINALPSGTEAMLILTGTPSWMKNSKNWINGNPRVTFAELWVKKVVTRYANKNRVRAFQIWNEPNNPDFGENVTLDVLNKPTNYVELLAHGYNAVKTVAPSKLVVGGATTAIAQNFPSTLNYNKAMIKAGVLSFVDVYAIHFYGKSIERVLLPGGVAEFVNSIKKPVWVTETGARGINKQLEYAERIFAFLKAKMPGIARIYIYQFTESTPAASTYGLRNLTPGLSISDLYSKLRDRPK